MWFGCLLVPKNRKSVMVGVEFKLNINGVVEEISDQGNADNVAFKTCAGVFTAPVYKTGDWREHTG